MNINGDMTTFGEHLDGCSNLITHCDLSEEQRKMHIMIGWHRDSDAITEANVKVFEEVLTEVDPEGDDWETHYFNHWAVGWTALLIVRPETAAYKEAYEMHCSLTEYPILREEMVCTCDTCQDYVLTEEMVGGEEGSYCSDMCRDDRESAECAECGEKTPNGDIVWVKETPYCDDECAACHGGDDD